jgi:hypothetical protein
MDEFDFQLHQLSLIEKKLIQTNKILSEGKFTSLPIRFKVTTPVINETFVPTLSIFYMITKNRFTYDVDLNWLKISISAKIEPINSKV